MLTCIVCSKQLSGGSLREPDDNDYAEAGGTPSTRQAIKALTSQIKDMALKASGAYRHCKPCAGSAAGGRFEESSEPASGSERFLYSYRRAFASGGSYGSTPGLRGLWSGDGTPSASGRTESAAAMAASFMEEDEESMEWVAQVEPGVLITFLSLSQGGNDLKRIRFSREMFNKRQAQQWWAENYDKVMELYNVQRFNSQLIPLPVPPRSEDESNKMDSAEDSPVTPPLMTERLPRKLQRPVSSSNAGCIGYSSSDLLEHNPPHCHHHYHHHHSGRHCYGSGGLVSMPKLSSISGVKTEISSMDASVRTCSSPEADCSGELSASVSNVSDLDREWVEEDEPGVYITIRALPGGIRELRRVRFRREDDSLETRGGGRWRRRQRREQEFGGGEMNIPAARGLARCMQGYGGMKTEQGYMSNISKRMNKAKMASLPWRYYYT